MVTFGQFLHSRAPFRLNAPALGLGFRDVIDDDPELMTKMFAVFSEGEEVKGDKKKA